MFALNAVTFAIFAKIVRKVKPQSPVPMSKLLASETASESREEDRKSSFSCCRGSVTLAEDPVLVLGPGLARHAFTSHTTVPATFSARWVPGRVLSSLLPRSRSLSTRGLRRRLVFSGYPS